MVFLRRFDGLTGSPGKSQGKPGGEDIDTTVWGDPPSCFKAAWSSWPSFWLFPGIPGKPSNAALLPSLPHTASMEVHTLTYSNLGEIEREIERDREREIDRERES